MLRREKFDLLSDKRLKNLDIAASYVKNLIQAQITCNFHNIFMTKYWLRMNTTDKYKTSITNTVRRKTEERWRVLSKETIPNMGKVHSF